MPRSAIIGMSSRLSQFTGEKYLNIETYRRSGQAVRTPVWFVESDGLLYVRTAEETGKFKRIQNNPSVQIAPCESRGKVKGDWVKAEARQASADTAQKMYRLFEQKYGFMNRMSRLFLRNRHYVVLEIHLAE